MDRKERVLGFEKLKLAKAGFVGRMEGFYIDGSPLNSRTTTNTCTSESTHTARAAGVSGMGSELGTSTQLWEDDANGKYIPR